MTLRLELGIDPGQTGAIGLLADGEYAGVIDMPTIARKAGGFQIDPEALAEALRSELTHHAGAYVCATIELVAARPGQGSTGMFRFGQSDGMARGVIGAMGIPLAEVRPERWKKTLELTKKEKDEARLLAISFYPNAEHMLKRKKDCGRADAILIARWAHVMHRAGECS